MVRSPLFSRRVHIAGSVSQSGQIASAEEVIAARAFLAELVGELVRRGANFVIPVDAKKIRPDGLEITFDWLVWKALSENLANRPEGSRDPLAIAVQHHKTEGQIPLEHEELWDDLRVSDRVYIENVAHWNMGSKRIEAQARWGDVLLTLGGGEGVLHAANLYHEAGKPVVPLNFELCDRDEGSRRLFQLGMSRDGAEKLFRTTDRNAHPWINRINFTNRTSRTERVRTVIDLLEALDRPKAFAVRLLNTTHADFADVDGYFETVVSPFVGDVLGHDLVVVDGKQPYDYARVDQEIFEKLHRSSLVVADVTGSRPNCFLELGYALAITLLIDKPTNRKSRLEGVVLERR
ncbi:MAG: hypothetical protein OXC09_08935 [Truepera sp.]|nr:hypothetical protein [Truepera sp.]